MIQFFKKASESIKPLLDSAIRVIPKDELHLSQITLKATAGLRLISDKIANKILSDVYIFIKFIQLGMLDRCVNPV